MQVVVVKRAGVMAYEEVAEEFGERCRVRARVVSLGDEGTQGAARSPADDLVVTVGQEALDAVHGTKARVIPTLAFETPEGLVGPPASPHPELILKVLAMARGQRIHTVGVVYGPRSATVVGAGDARRRAAGADDGDRARGVGAGGGARAARAVGARRCAVAARRHRRHHAQVFQYALRLQLERGLPVAAATRQQVHSGALVAADFSPRAAGRIAADLANRYLEGRTAAGDPSEVDWFSGARVTVNAQVARRLGVDAVGAQAHGGALRMRARGHSRARAAAFARASSRRC